MLSKARSEDTTVLFIAGHGISEGHGADYMFLPEGAEIAAARNFNLEDPPVRGHFFCAVVKGGCEA
jgi:hypothetical protein